MENLQHTNLWADFRAMRFFVLGSLFVVAACPGGGGPIDPTYENVAMVIDRSCAISSSCHSEGGKGMLSYDGVDDYTTPLNGVPACEYDLMPRVDPGNPDNSWLMVKLEGAYDETGHIEFEPSAEWDPVLDIASECPINDGETVTGFGTNMPQNVGEPAPLPAREIEMFREWILAGARGPSEGP